MARRLLLASGAAALLLCATMLLDPAPRLVWNASASTPTGPYWVQPSQLPQPGDWVVLPTPERVRDLAAARHYIPANVPLVKRVAAGAGQLVCTQGRVLTIDGAAAASRKSRDPRGRPLPAWQGCRRLGAGELLVLGTAPGSFDSRYFGPVTRDRILGKAVPIWLH